MRQRNDVGRLFLRRLGLFALFLLVVFSAWSVWGASRKARESQALKAQAQAAAEDLSLQEKQLQTNITKLGSERGREEVLRDQYAVGRRGEGLIVIVDPATTTPVSVPPTFLERVQNAIKWW